MRHPFLVPPQGFPVSKQLVTLDTFKLASGKTSECVKCPLVASETNRIAKHHATHLATARLNKVQAVVSVSRLWTRECLATNPAFVWLEAFMDVLVHVKPSLRSKAPVTVNATPEVVLVVHLATELVMTGKGRRPRTDHEALLTLYWPIYKNTRNVSIIVTGIFN